MSSFWNFPDEPVDHKSVDWKWPVQSLQSYTQQPSLQQQSSILLGSKPVSSKFDINPRLPASLGASGALDLKKMMVADVKRGIYPKHPLLDQKQSLDKQQQQQQQQQQQSSSLDKRFKTLPPAEMLPRNETLGGYIFVCNNDTMQEDLKRQLFGLPQRFRDSVRAIQPGLPLFLYNYTTHQLHGVFEATSFGGSNIDPTAWEDKKCRGESRFPAQVRIRVRKLFKALEEDAFRPVLYHYDGPKFRLQLSVPETLELLDLFSLQGSP